MTKEEYIRRYGLENYSKHSKLGKEYQKNKIKTDALYKFKCAFYTKRKRYNNSSFHD